MNIYINEDYYNNIKIATIDRIEKDIFIKLEPKTSQERIIKIEEKDLMITSFENS